MIIQLMTELPIFSLYIGKKQILKIEKKKSLITFSIFGAKILFGLSLLSHIHMHSGARAKI